MGEAEAFAAERWEVWRQDDNGNRYLVSAHADKAAAEHHVADLESGVVHKQSYWVSEKPPPRWSSNTES